MPFPARQFDALLSRMRGRFGRRATVGIPGGSFALGVYGLLCLVPLLIIMGVVGSLTGEEPRPSTGWGELACILAGAALLLLTCQYVVAKVRSASLTAISASPVTVISTAVLDCVALLALVAAVLAPPLGFVFGYRWAGPAGCGFAGALGCVLAAGCLSAGAAALNPERLNVAVDPAAGAGRGALGLFSMLLKIKLTVAPVFFLGCVVASLWLVLIVFCRMLRDQVAADMWLVARQACTIIGLFTAAYVLLYLTYLLYHLFVDLAKSVFDIADNTKRR